MVLVEHAIGSIERPMTDADQWRSNSMDWSIRCWASLAPRN